MAYSYCHGGDIETFVSEFGAQPIDLSANINPFGVPEAVRAAMHRAVDECVHYPDPFCRAARQAVAEAEGIPADMVYCGNGAADVLDRLAAVLRPKRVLLTAPTFAEYERTLTDAKIDFHMLRESEDFAVTERLLSDISSKYDAVYLCNPNNPTGALYPKEVLEGIVEIARQHHLIIFSDEIYDRLVMDGGEHISIASLAPDLFCVTFSGLSKSHMIAGFRIGWMILSGNKSIAKDYMEGLNMLSNMRLCSNVPAQSIVQTALGGHQSVNGYIVPGGRIYEQREYIYKALNDIPGISAVKPKAAFYIFPKIDTKKFNIYDDEKFALDLLREKKILIIHGAGFNWGEPDHFRVVYLPRIEVLKDAVDKMEDFLKTYKQR